MIKKWLKNEEGFTLIEMLIVLLVITVILLIALPNVTKHSSSINDKGCKALVQMVQGQVQAYQMDEHAYPTLEELAAKGYIGDQEKTCPNGNPLTIDGSTGLVKEEGSGG